MIGKSIELNFVSVLAYAIGFFLAASTIAILTAVVLIWGPGVEGAIDPVIIAGAPNHVVRDKGKVCFALPLIKRRAGDPLRYTFAIQTAFGAVIPVSVYPTDDTYQPTREVLVNHAVGLRWTRDYCFLLPGTIADVQGFVVTGEAVHRVSHRLWDVSAALPAFYVPPAETIRAAP